MLVELIQFSGLSHSVAIIEVRVLFLTIPLPVSKRCLSGSSFDQLRIPSETTPSTKYFLHHMIFNSTNNWRKVFTKIRINWRLTGKLTIYRPISIWMFWFVVFLLSYSKIVSDLAVEITVYWNSIFCEWVQRMNLFYNIGYYFSLMI